MTTCFLLQPSALPIEATNERRKAEQDDMLAKVQKDLEQEKDLVISWTNIDGTLLAFPLSKPRFYAIIEGVDH